VSDDVTYYEHDAVNQLARKFEMQAYDLRAHLKKFDGDTGEEAISDGFGFLTESEEVRSTYVGYSTSAADAMKFVHEYLDSIADALRKVNRDTEVTDDGMAALFGKNDGGNQ